MAGLHRSFVLSVAVAIAFSGSAQAASPPGLSTRAADQIAALQKIKRSLSPAERKLSSRLVVLLRQRASAKLAAGLPRLRAGVTTSKTGTTEVDIRSKVAGRALVKRLEALGATVRHASARFGSIRAAVPVTALERVAGWADVQRVDVAIGRKTEAVRPPRVESKAARSARLGARLRQALSAPAAGPQGAVVSEGDKAHAADRARAGEHVTGIGVKLCALSDGVDSLAASEAAGELPDVDVLPGQAGEGDEGTAMLEIMHDIAPGAELGFATAFESEESFAENILALRSDADCDVIVDDVLYFDEPTFQDGLLARAVERVSADGALYFSSAGNEGNVRDGTSGNYERKFADSGQTVGKFVGTAHDFDPGSGVQVYEPVTDESAGAPAVLQWANPWGRASDDYDLYEFDGDGNVVAFSQDVQNGDDDPFEILGTDFFSVDARLAVVKFRGADHTFQLSVLRGRYEDANGLEAYVTPGVTRGHSAAASAFSVGAAPAADPLPFDLEPGDPPNPSGPFPDPFAASQRLERFTSDGPRRIFFRADGSSAGGGIVRQKPDIAAADGVSTSLPEDSGFNPFFGTSAAAPHAAAIAGLVLSGNPDATRAEVRQAFNATALDVAPAGRDNRAGAGLLRADRVLDYTGATPQPLVEAGTPTVTPTTGDGDAYLEPGETGTVSLPLTNVGDGGTTAVAATVTSDSAQATVTPRRQAYGDLAAGATAARAFTVELAPGYPVGRPLELAVRVTFVGVLSPTTDEVRIPTGQPAAAPTDFAYTGAVVPIPDDDAAGATVSIPVSGIGYANALTFSVDGSTCTTTEGATTVGIDHTFVSDLTGVLISPSGTEVALFDGDGGSGNNLCKVVFSDAATDPFSTVLAADAPFTGTWRPAEPLSPLLDAPVDGTWKLRVVDGVGADTGSIRAVSIHIRGYVH